MNNKTIGNAAKWSVVTEVAAKLVTPISNMILARLLTPEAFGVVATATMVFSFADMFTDSGFQKYLVQHEFENNEERNKATNVAFWTNLVLSLLFWLFISIFSNPLADAVGNPGMGKVLIIACMSLPLTSFSSIQMALYRRDFDFKTLFYVRMVGAVIPLIITVPLAMITHSYWALIIGTLCGNLSNAFILTVRSKWKPSPYFSFEILKQMLSFSIWSLVEAISIWLTSYLDVFIVGAFLSSYYLGVYKTAMNTVNQIMNLITASTTTVLFSALSRVQSNKIEFDKLFFKFQRNVGLLLLPMGIGICIYRRFITKILLGGQWGDAANFIGLWALVNATKVLFSNYCSEAYRAMGRPKISVMVQISQLVFLIPAMFFGAQYRFDGLYIARCLVSCELIFVNLVVVKCTLDIYPLKMLKNIIWELLASGCMGGVAILLRRIHIGIAWSIVSIGICVLVYFALIMLIPGTRKQFKPYIENYIKLLHQNRK